MGLHGLKFTASVQCIVLPFTLDQFDLEEMCYVPHSDAEGCVLMHVEGAHSSYTTNAVCRCKPFLHG